MFDKLFVQKQLSPERLIAYGFVYADEEYHGTCPIMDGEFDLHVVFDRHGRPDTRLIEVDTGEEYVLYRTDAEGGYVGTVREAIAAVLAEIAERCFMPSVFRQKQTMELLGHAAEAYGDGPEFLWRETPQNGILRRADSGKWYAAILTVSMRKLGLDADKPVEIVNLHAAPETVAKLLERPAVYPAWHMNKKSWYTVILDGSVENAELFLWLGESYRLAGRPAKGTPKKRKTNGA